MNSVKQAYCLWFLVLVHREAESIAASRAASLAAPFVLGLACGR